MLKQILLDLDGVLGDFQTSAVRLFRSDAERFIRDWPLGEYDIAKCLGISQKELWGQISSGGDQFWRDLELLPWAKALFDHCKELAPTIIATKPGLDASGASGKMRWMQTHFGGLRFRSFLIGPPKEFCAKPGAVLIDDMDENIEVFVAAGGQGILFPRPWNSNHRLSKEAVDYTLARLSEFAAPPPAPAQEEEPPKSVARPEAPVMSAPELTQDDI